MELNPNNVPTPKKVEGIQHPNKQLNQDQEIKPESLKKSPSSHLNFVPPNRDIEELKLSQEEDNLVPNAEKMCRICFMTANQRDILTNPCKCKGSMSFVHEDCLTRWLQFQNVRKCELCKTNFIMVEEYGSFSFIVKKNFKYLTQDRKRLMISLVYGVYLFLFGKRLTQLFTYFKDLIVAGIRKFLSLFSAQMASTLAAEVAAKTLLKSQAASQVQQTGLKRVLLKMLKVCKFFYSLLISMQLLFLAVTEFKRLKKMIAFMINNSKIIRIKSHQYSEQQ